MMNKIRDARAEVVLYFFGWIGIVVGIVYFEFLKYTDFNLLENGRSCIVHSLFGFYCPGCGGTRAFIFLMQGKLLKSFSYHPLILYLAVVGGYFMITQTLQFATKGRIRGMKYKNQYVYIGVFILVVQWILKNVVNGYL